MFLGQPFQTFQRFILCILWLLFKRGDLHNLWPARGGQRQLSYNHSRMDGKLAANKLVNGPHLQRFARKLGKGSLQPIKSGQMVYN
jgi:hypothetical protein